MEDRLQAHFASASIASFTQVGLLHLCPFNASCCRSPSEYRGEVRGLLWLKLSHDLGNGSEIACEWAFQNLQ